MVAPPDYRKFERLAQKVIPHSRLIRAWSLQGGISAEMTALEVQRPDGSTQKMIVRRPGENAYRHNPQAAQIEYLFLQKAQVLGLTAPRPYLLDESGDVFPTPCFVIEFVEGQLDFAPSDQSRFCQQAAEQLAKIHSAKHAHLDLSFLPRLPEGFEQNFGRRPEQVDETLAEGRVRDVLEAAWPLQRRNAALLHGDYWPGNWLWRDGQLVAVIDWEDAVLGDPLSDFATSRLEILWILGTDAMHAFTNHYQSMMAIDYTDLPYWDLCAALRLIRVAGPHLSEWAAFFHPFGRTDITEQTMRAHHRLFTAQAFEALDRRRVS